MERSLRYFFYYHTEKFLMGMLVGMVALLLLAIRNEVIKEWEEPIDLKQAIFVKEWCAKYPDLKREVAKYREDNCFSQIEYKEFVKKAAQMELNTILD